MKKAYKIFAIILSIILLKNLYFSNIVRGFNLPKKDSPITIYEQKVEGLTNSQLDKLWPSNNPRTWISTGIMDGEIIKKYKTWHNRYTSQVKGTADERGLEDNTDLTIHIKNLNINSSDYQDLRLVLDYLSNNSNNSLTHTYSMELYAIDTNLNKYGPFNVAEFELTGFYMRKAGLQNVYERNFNIISENINLPKNIIIKELELKPYANYPQIRNAGKTVKGNWRGADGTLFSIAGIKVLGYKSTFYQRPEYIKYKKIDVNKTREKIVKRMYDLATVKWSPAIEFHDTCVVGEDPKSIKSTYSPGKVYYGMPYTQRNRVTLECFANQTHDKVLAKPVDILKIWGADCASSVTYAISKYIPMHVIYNTTDFLWDRNKTTVLGKIKLCGKSASSDSVKKNYTQQQIYAAYAELQKGDVVSTHHKFNTHVRLISGNTHVNKNNDGSINPDKSYFIYTDIRISQANTKKGSNDFGGLITKGKDDTVPFEPKIQFTDIISFAELEGKNLNFNINKKSSFKDAYNGNYIPITLNSYLTSTIEEPYARIINPNNSVSIKSGLKGTIYSNYTITSVIFTIKNKKNGKEKIFTVFPNHNTGSLEGMYGNTYSLYHNTPDYIKNYIKETVQKTNSFSIQISISVGENNNIKVIRFNRQ